MKKIFIVILIVFGFSFSVYASNATRNYQYGKRFFVIEFERNEDWCTVPAIANAQPHWGAKISVFEIINGKQILVCDPFDGEYTAKGCFEDDPKMLVEKAIRIKQDKILNEGEKASNVYQLMPVENLQDENVKDQYYQAQFWQHIDKLNKDNVPYDYILISFVNNKEDYKRYNTYCIDKKTRGQEMDHYKIFEIMKGMYESWVDFLLVKERTQE